MTLAQKAHYAVFVARRDGDLVAPDLCTICHKALALNAHHHSYEPEHWLDIVWLCNSCHRKRHSQILTIAKFARRHGFTIEAVMGWIASKSLRPPIVTYGTDGEPKVDESEWEKEFAA